MPTVLIVDDTAVDRRLAGGILEKSSELEVCYAENGTEALLKIGNELPDLVVTDLQMPELDGLQLVNQINERYPNLPVVLMTAHGSEVIAAQALASGAACYVPKNDLAENLAETVSHILAISDSDARYNKLISCAKKTEFEFELVNDPELIEPIVDLVQQLICSQELMDSTSRVRLGVAMEHALLNAMIRGNLEMSRDEFPVVTPENAGERSRNSDFENRMVYVHILVTLDKCEILIRDQGPGFDVAMVPKAGDPDSFKDGIGRGLVLMTTFMDHVEFSQHGRQVSMTKGRTNLPNKPR
ncbi:response regulator [bacterium]|nr:response regulator [bacterium]